MRHSAGTEKEVVVVGRVVDVVGTVVGVVGRVVGVVGRVVEGEGHGTVNITINLL